MRDALRGRTSNGMHTVVWTVKQKSMLRCFTAKSAVDRTQAVQAQLIITGTNE